MVGLQKIVLDIAEYVVDSLTEPPLHEGSEDLRQLAKNESV